MTPLLSVVLAVGAPSFFAEIAALLVAGAVIAFISYRFGLVPIVGFLIAGIVIGPNGLGLVRDIELVDAAAEVGVVLLLFTIGIEFSLERLARIQRLIFGGGGLQVGLTTAAVTALLAAFGVDWRAGVFTGFLVALSSTAIVLKLLADRSEANEEHGQVGLGLLIFQDLAVIAMVLLVPMLAGSGGSAAEIGWALGKAALLIVGVLVVARRLMPPVLEAVARTCSPELFLLTVIAICFGTAYLTSLAGVSLSLGAFLAGLIVSESAFSEHALGEIMPLQILFSATFFVSVGMLFDPGFLLSNLLLVAAVVAAVLAVKVATTWVSIAALGYQLPVAAASALMLAQIGEFSFVLERAGRELGLYPAGMSESGSQTFIAATVVLMMLTPPLMSIGGRMAARAERRMREVARERVAEQPTDLSLPALSNHIIVAGYGGAARRLVRVVHQSGIPYLITTLDPIGANEAEREGLPVLRGDASRLHTLQLASVEDAKVFVIADDDPAMARRIAAVARTANPTMRILVRTRYMADAEALQAVGVDLVITEQLEGIVQMFAAVLREYRVAPEQIEAQEEVIRSGGYHALDAPTPAEVELPACTLGKDCFDTRTVTVRHKAPAEGRALGALELERHGITVSSLRRNGSTMTPPSPDVRLEAGDTLELTGSTSAFADSAALFRSAGTEPMPEPTSTPAASRSIDMERTVQLDFGPGARECAHLEAVRAVTPSAPGCEDCLRIGDRWVHLRICMTCGHVGCCDSSPNRHASKHFHATEHPIMRSLEPGETWGWCFVDEVLL